MARSLSRARTKSCSRPAGITSIFTTPSSPLPSRSRTSNAPESLQAPEQDLARGRSERFQACMAVSPQLAAGAGGRYAPALYLDRLAHHGNDFLGMLFDHGPGESERTSRPEQE